MLLLIIIFLWKYFINTRFNRISHNCKLIKLQLTMRPYWQFTFKTNIRPAYKNTSNNINFMFI